MLFTKEPIAVLLGRSFRLLENEQASIGQFHGAYAVLDSELLHTGPATVALPDVEPARYALIPPFAFHGAAQQPGEFQVVLCGREHIGALQLHAAAATHLRW